MTRAYRFDLNGSRLSPGDLQLEVEDIELRFGGVQAIRKVGLDVLQGEIHAIIGPNGAGKTSLLNCISGLYRPQAGSIRFHARSWSAFFCAIDIRSNRDNACLVSSFSDSLPRACVISAFKIRNISGGVWVLRRRHGRRVRQGMFGREQCHPVLVPCDHTFHAAARRGAAVAGIARARDCV